MYHSDWFQLRFELLCDYPNRKFDIGSVLDAFEFEGTITLDRDKSINPVHYPTHFRKVRWWEHRTIEQLLTLKYMKIITGSNYYAKGDIVEVTNFYFNNYTIVGGKNNLLFDLKGHHFIASELEPATKKEHDAFLEKEKSNLK